METFSPSPFYTKEVEEFCDKYIYQATVDARANAYAETERVQFDNKYMCHDIGKAIDEA